MGIERVDYIQRSDKSMDYSRQVSEISNYFRSHEKTKDAFKIGVELEHFIVDLDSLRTISIMGKWSC